MSERCAHQTREHGVVLRCPLRAGHSEPCSLELGDELAPVEVVRECEAHGCSGSGFVLALLVAGGVLLGFALAHLI
jgi:hypothetical protein